MRAARLLAQPWRSPRGAAVRALTARDRASSLAVRVPRALDAWAGRGLASAPSFETTTSAAPASEAGGPAGPPDLVRGSVFAWGSGALGLPESDATGMLSTVKKFAPHKPTVHGPLAGRVITKLAFGGQGGAAITERGAIFTWGAEKWTLGHGTSVKSLVKPRRIEALRGIPIVDVSVGTWHAGAVSAAGEAFTWGWGGTFGMGQGALGHGNKVDQAEPALVEFFEKQSIPVVQLLCAERHSIALSKDGRVFAFGEGESGRLGNGIFARAEPAQVEFPTADIVIHRVATGRDHTLAVDSRGRVWGWGKNGMGQLGLGAEAAIDLNAAEALPVVNETLVNEGEVVVDVEAGDQGSIVLTQQGHVFIYGDRTHLQPFLVETLAPPESPAGAVSLLQPQERVVRIAAARSSYGALTNRGRVFTWGKNLRTGTSGRGAGIGSNVPMELGQGMGEGSFFHNTLSDLFMGGDCAAAIVGPIPQLPRTAPIRNSIVTSPRA